MVRIEQVAENEDGVALSILSRNLEVIKCLLISFTYPLFSAAALDAFDPGVPPQRTHDVESFVVVTNSKPTFAGG